MKGGWQAGIVAWFAVLVAGPVGAADEGGAFDYQPPVTQPMCFDAKLGMLERERGEYATHLATHAGNLVVEAKAGAAALAEARRLLGLALHLSPRNRKALVVNYQLRRGIMPEPTAGDYSAGVLARLLLTRADLLKREGGAQNDLLARAFIDLAARMDPRNEDAVFAAELQRLDHGELDWAVFTDGAAKPLPSGEGGGGAPPEGGRPAGEPGGPPRGADKPGGGGAAPAPAPSRPAAKR